MAGDRGALEERRQASTAENSQGTGEVLAAPGWTSWVQGMARSRRAGAQPPVGSWCLRAVEYVLPLGRVSPGPCDCWFCFQRPPSSVCAAASSGHPEGWHPPR